MRLRRFRLTQIGIGFWLILCALWCLFGYQSKVAAGKAFGNMTYLTTYPNIAEKVTLVNGWYKWSERSKEGFFSYYGLYYEGHYVYGDFNRDGLNDAAAVISEGEGGSGDFRALAFLIHDGTRLVHRQSVALGDRVVIRAR